MVRNNEVLTAGTLLLVFYSESFPLMWFMCMLRISLSLGAGALAADSLARATLHLDFFGETDALFLSSS